MAVKNYTGGKLSIEGTTIGYAVNARVNTNVRTANTTIFDADWDDYTWTGKGWQMSFSCHHNPDDAGQAAFIAKWVGSGTPTLTSISYYEDATNGFTGSGIITSCEISKSVGAPDTLTGSVQGCGTLAEVS